MLLAETWNGVYMRSVSLEAGKNYIKQIVVCLVKVGSASTGINMQLTPLQLCM